MLGVVGRCWLLLVVVGCCWLLVVGVVVVVVVLFPRFLLEGGRLREEATLK